MKRANGGCGKGIGTKSDAEAAGNKVREFVRYLGCKLKRAVYPERVTCDLCSKELVADTRYPLCAACTETVTFTDGKVCLCCGAPINDEADYCIRCQNTESVFRLNRSAMVYDGGAKKLVYSLKFGGKKYIAKTLGAMMSDAFLRFGMEADIIVPVPMSEKEVKKRGFNQAELIAREVGGRMNIPVLPALQKVKETLPQKELSGRERAENLKGCFAVAYSDWIAGRKILLVDDVFTTGATANECAKTLFKAKVRQVSVLTAAVTKTKLPVEQSKELDE